MNQPLEIWLSLDLSAPVGSYALHERREDTLRLLSEVVTDGGPNHTETAVERITELLKEAGLSLGRVDRFLTPLGPGSFTGLRLAISTVKAFAFALQKPITTLGASEARWLAHGSKTTGAALTHSTSEKFVVSRFDAQRHPGFETVERFDTIPAEVPLVLLGDGRIPLEKLPEAWRKKVETFPLRARHLAESANRASTRRDYTNAGEWIALSPEYLGTSIKPISGGA